MKPLRSRVSTRLPLVCAIAVAFLVSSMNVQALTFGVDTVLACCGRDTLLTVNSTPDPLTVDSVTGRIVVLHTSRFVLTGALWVTSPSGPGGSNKSFSGLGDSLTWSSGIHTPIASLVPATYRVTVQSPSLDAPFPLTKRLAAAGTDTMAVMVTFHSSSGNDSVLFLNTQANKVAISGVEPSARGLRQDNPHLSATDGTFTIRGEWVRTTVPARGVAVVFGQSGAATRVLVQGRR